MHVHDDLITLSAIIVVALVCGTVFSRLRQPALVGYLLCGFVLGPSGFGLVESRQPVTFLADLGVLLLLFVVGMELSLRSFRAVLGVAVTAAALQIVCAVGIMWLFAFALDWPTGVAVLLGFVVALSSTAVVVKMLEELNLLRTEVGQVTVAVLIAQDLAIVPMMLLINLLVGDSSVAGGIFKIALSVLLLALLVWFLSRREKIQIPFGDRLAASPELRPLFALALCFGAATLTGMLGLSAPYGAFLAGLLIGNSTIRPALLQEAKPIENLLMMVFFLSIGLLIDLGFVWDNIGKVLTILFIITVVKTVINVGILRILKETWANAFLSGVLLAQIGEFSFLLSIIGRDVGLINADGHQLIVTVTALTLLVTPLWLTAAQRMLRISVAGADTIGDIATMICHGGIKAVWLSARGRTLPTGLALRKFGRPRRKSVRDVLDSDPTAAIDDPPAESGNTPSAETESSKPDQDAKETP
jgi:K+:H+ antiporter